MDVRPGFENHNRLVGVASFDNIESSVCDHFRRMYADQEIIFHNKDDGRLKRSPSNEAGAFRA
jgi:hypothetical protein